MEVLVCGVSQCFTACCMSYGFTGHEGMIQRKNDVFTLAVNSSCSDVTFNVFVEFFLTFVTMK